MKVYNFSTKFKKSKMEGDTVGSISNQTSKPHTQYANEEGPSCSHMMKSAMKTYMKREVDNDVVERKLLDKIADQSAIREFYEQKLVELQTDSKQLDAKHQKNIASNSESLLKCTKNMEAVSNAICAHVKRSESDLKGSREQRAQLKQRHDILEQQLMSLAKEAAEQEALEKEVEILREYYESLEKADKFTESLWNSSEQLKGDAISTLEDKHTAMQCQLTAAENRLQQAKVTLDEVTKRKDSLTDEAAQLERSLLQMELEHNNEMAEMNKTKVQCEKRLSKDRMKIELLKKSINNQRNFTKSIRDENSPLQQAIEEIEKEQKKLISDITEKNHQIEEFKKSIENGNAKNTSLIEETKKLDVDTQKALQTLEEVKEKMKSTDANLELLDSQIRANTAAFSEKETQLVSEIQRLTEIISAAKSVEELELELAEELADIEKYKEIRSDNEKLHAAELEKLREQMEKVDASIAKKKEEVEKLRAESEQQSELKTTGENLKSEHKEMSNKLSSLGLQLKEEQTHVAARERNIEKLQATIDTTKKQIEQLQKKSEGLNSKKLGEEWAQKKKGLLEERARLEPQVVNYEAIITAKEAEVRTEFIKLCEEHSQKMSKLRCELEEIQRNSSSQDAYNKRLEQDLSQAREDEAKERLELDKLRSEKEALEKMLHDVQQKEIADKAGDAGRSLAPQKRVLKPSERRSTTGAGLSQTKSVQFAVPPPPPANTRLSVYDFSSDSDSAARDRMTGRPSTSTPIKRKMSKFRQMTPLAVSHQLPRKRSSVRASLPPPPPAPLSQPGVVSRASQQATTQANSTREEEPTRDVDGAEK